MTPRREATPFRVLHLAPALFAANDGVIGGAERYVFELARHMAEAVPTTLVTFGDRGREEHHGPLRLRVIGDPWYVRGQRTNPMALPLFRELRSATFVHCHQQHVLASSVAALFCRLRGTKVFVTDLGGGGWDISGYVSTDAWYHGHLHISEYSRKVFGHQGKPWAHVISGGVDPNKFSANGTVCRDGTVLFVGRILPHKGVNYLVEAVTPDMPLEIIGQPDDPEFLDHLKTLAVGKRVTFRHDCNDEGLVQAYRRALCVVLPSVYQSEDGRRTNVPELLGQTLLEGMACGAPVICTDVASMPEVVEDGVNGFIVPPNNAAALRERLEWLRQRPSEAAAMGWAGRRRVLERFTWSAVVHRCLAIYRSPAQTDVAEDVRA